MNYYLIKSFVFTFILIQFYQIGLVNCGENQWATFIIENHTPKTLYLTDVVLHYGKWHRTGCKSCELKNIDQTIGPGSHALINIAGRLLSPTGCEAEFAIYDGPKEDKTVSQILHAYFSVPYLIGTENTVNIRPFKLDQYPIEATGGRPRDSALGFVKIKIYGKDDLEPIN